MLQSTREAPDHIRWQERVRKEERATAGSILGFQGQKGSKLIGVCEDPWDHDFIAPLHDLHRTFSAPTVLPRIGTGSSHGSRVPTAYSLGGRPLDVNGLPLPRRVPRHLCGRDLEEEGARGIAGPTRPLSTSSHQSRSHRTASTTASRKFEVLRSVRDEAAKAVEPEAVAWAAPVPGQEAPSRRDRLEAMLRQARGQVG